MKVKDAFKLCSSNANYRPFHARRKLLEMPCAILGTGHLNKGTYQLYLCERESPSRLKVLQSFLEKVHTHNAKKGEHSKASVKELLHLADSEGERQRLK